MKRSSSCAMVLIAMLAVQTQGYCTWNTQQTPGTSSNSSVSTALVVGAVVVVGLVVAIQLGKRHSVAFYPVLSGAPSGIPACGFPGAMSFKPVALVADPVVGPAFSSPPPSVHPVLEAAPSGAEVALRAGLAPERWTLSMPLSAPMAPVSAPAMLGSGTASWGPRIETAGEPLLGNAGSARGTGSPLVP